MTGQPIDPPHNDSVALLCVLEEPLHPRPLDRRPTSRGHIGKNVALLHAGGDECVELQLGIGSKY